MTRPLLTTASVFTFLFLVLVAAVLSHLDLLLTDDPGRSWESSRAFVNRWLWIEDDPAGNEEEGEPSRHRITCTEIDGEVREILLTGDEFGSVLEWHLLGCPEMVVERAEDDAGPDTDLSREWE